MVKPHRSPRRAPALKSWRKAPGRPQPTQKPDPPPSGLLHRLWKWIVAAVAAPLAAFLGLYATGLLNNSLAGVPARDNEIFPSASDLACQVRELTRSPEPGTTFRILLTTLEHDADGRQTRHVSSVFQGQTTFKPPPFEVVRTCRVLKIDYGVTQSEIEGRKRGRALLDAYQADVKLWFLSRKGDTLTPQTQSSNKLDYELEKTTLVPKDFGEEFAIQLMALALSSIQPLPEQDETYLVAAMRPVAARLDALRAHPPAFFTPLQKATLNHSFAMAAQTIGEQAGETKWLEQAVEAFRAALQEYSRERAPLQWATTQNNLGNALETLGKRESSTARLEEAVQAYRAALNIFDAAHAEYYRNIVQRNVDRVSSILEARNSGK